MPLWSNEEWRARIGSCWCALGRPLNSRFTRNRGKSNQILALHQLATMVIMLMLFIAANVGLCTTEEHKNLICIVLFGETLTELRLFRFGLLLGLFLPIFKFIVQIFNVRLTKKIKMSLKQFFVDLNECFCFITSVIQTFIISPVLFMVNFVTGKINVILEKFMDHLTKLTHSGDQHSNGNLMWSLIIVIITSIQLFISVVVAHAIVFILLTSRNFGQNPGPGLSDYFVVKGLTVELETTAVQASLLLRCGDIEANPGPLTRENIERIDNSSELTEEDFREVYREIVSVKAYYFNLGRELGLPHGELEAIWKAFHQDIDQALDKVLLAWLRQCYDVKTHGAPTWQRLVEAVNSPTGCNNPALAMAIANKHLVNGDGLLVNIPRGCQSLRSSHFVWPSLAHAPMYNLVPPPLPYLHDQGNHAESDIFNQAPLPLHTQDQLCRWSHWRGNFAQLPSANVMSNLAYAYAQDQPHYLQAEGEPRYEYCMHGVPHLKSSPLPWTETSHNRVTTILPRWRKMLEDSYLVQENSMDAWPPLKIVEFVQLALVNHDNSAYHINLHTVQEDVDAVYGQKTNVCLKEIFEKIGNKSLLLFEGRPGSGKSTLMVNVSCDWGRGNVFKSKLLVFVRLRNLNKKEDICLCDLLKGACPAFSRDDVIRLSSHIERMLGKDVVFLLDGFDEYTYGANEESFISKLISKFVYSESIVMLSSRPAATQRFRQDATVWIEVVGFFKEQVLQYIDSVLEKSEEKSSIIQHLEDHKNLMNLCYLPLHCAMLVFLYKVDAALPKTETEFYRDFTLSILFRGIRKQVKDTKLKRRPKLKSFECLPYEEKVAFQKVCKLAFEATVAGRQIFEQSEVEDICFNDSSDDDDSLGLVVIDRYFAKSGVDETYTFLHLTLQEYLAAVFVAGLSESQQIETIRFANRHIFVTLRFLFGILDYSKDTTKDLFKQMLGITENDHLHHIHCAYETQHCHTSASTDVVTFHNESFYFESINNSSDMYCITYVLKSAEYVAIKLSFYNCNFKDEDLIALLKGVRDRQLSLIIGAGKAVVSILNTLGHLKIPGLNELKVFHNDKKTQLMGSHNFKHSTSILRTNRLAISNCGLEEGLKCFNQTLMVNFELCDFNKEDVLGFLRNYEDRHLSLTIIHGQTFLDALRLVTVPGLIELTVVRSGVLNIQVLHNILKYSTNFQKLSLREINISNCGLEEGFQHWSNLVELKPTAMVTIEWCDFTKEVALGLLRAFGNCHLSLSIRNSEVVQALLDAIRFVTVPGLIELIVIGEDDVSLSFSPKYLKYSTNLQILVLSLINISHSGVEEGFKHWPNLVMLEIEKTYCPLAVLEEIKHCTNLVHIKLYQCDIDASGAEVLRRCLYHTSKLQTLELPCNPIGDDGLNWLSIPVKNCRELKKLKLWCTRLTDASITCLTEWIKELNNLEHLDLQMNRMTKRGVGEIKKAVRSRRGVTTLKLDISLQTQWRN